MSEAVEGLRGREPIMTEGGSPRPALIMIIIYPYYDHRWADATPDHTISDRAVGLCVVPPTLLDAAVGPGPTVR